MSEQKIVREKLSAIKPPPPGGLDDVVAAQTALSLVDGENSALSYRGIAVQELAEKSNYEETVFLLWEGRLPGKKELEAFRNRLAGCRQISPEILDEMTRFPKTAHPMAFLRSMVSFLGACDPEAENLSATSLRTKAEKLTAVLPVILSAFFRIRQGLKPVVPHPGLMHAENFLYMMHGKKPEAEGARALDAYLILLADHGLNASTFAARVTCATESDMYSAVTSAIGTLKGVLHGAANQKAMEMFLEIGAPDKAEAYVLNKLAEKKKIMGFGHRVYKKKDPRAAVFRAIAGKMLMSAKDSAWMEIAGRVEKVMTERKKLQCNVDFYSAPVLYLLGFPVDFFTTVFAASRIAGWTGHVMEQLAHNRLIRPGADYTGPLDIPYITMEKRDLI